MCFVLGAWVALSALYDPIDRLRRGLGVPRAVLGMTLAHVGVGVFVIAVAAVETYTAERDVALRAGETVSVGGYDFRFDGVRPIEGPNYSGLGGIIVISRDGVPVATLLPEKRRYWVQQTVLTEAGIDVRLARHLFVALGDDLGEGKWSVRVQIRPLISFVWYAAGLMALGGFLAALDRRYRVARVREEVPLESSQGSAA